MPAPRPLPPNTQSLDIDALRASLAHDCGQPVKLIETHLSWVLLTPERAYKLKRPVTLPFVDFATPDARRHFCEEELRLNQRLAPSLYLAVVPVRGTLQAPRLSEAANAPGEVIDHAVVMRRFPDGALLHERLAAGTLDVATLDRLAQVLADFHRTAAVAPAGSAFGSPDSVAHSAESVLSQIEALGANAHTRALRPWLAAQHALLQDLWQGRRCSGKVRECHGDLHLSNLIAVGDDVTAFDAIEFDPQLRWIDTQSDIAFVTMDLKAHGRSDLAFGFLDSYLQASGDHDGLAVLRYHEVQRALVRALVSRLGGASGGPDYLACAHRLAQGEPAGPRLLITHGLSGSGKSHLARQLVVAAGAVRLRSDLERKRLFGLGPLDRSTQAQPIYTPEATQRTFAHLRQLAGVALHAGYPVIVDAAFLRHDEREAFRALATLLGLPFTLLHCEAPDVVLRERLQRRAAQGQDASEADTSVLDQQLGFQEPLRDEEAPHTLVIDTTQPLDVPGIVARWCAASVTLSEVQ